VSLRIALIAVASAAATALFSTAADAATTADFLVTSMTASVDQAKVGDTVTFVVETANFGPDSEDFIVHFDRSPGFGSNPEPQWICDRGVSPDTPDCEYGTVPQYTRQISVLIAQVQPTTSRVAHVTACAIGPNTDWFDPDTSNNCATKEITIIAPPTSSAAVPACSKVGDIPVAVQSDPATTPKVAYYRVDGAATQAAPVSGSPGTGAIHIPDGRHTVEYWGADSLGQEEPAHHTESVLADAGAPVVTMQSDPSATTYDEGVAATVTTHASDAGSGLASDPSSAGERLATAHAGRFALTKSATDGCGNSGTGTFAYTVRPVVAGLAVVPSGSGARFSYTRADAGKTRFSLSRRGSHPHSARTFVREDAAGPNHFRLRRLRPGRYRLRATPTANGVTGSRVVRTFRIAP
jgi:hypothetical protein